MLLNKNLLKSNDNSTTSYSEDQELNVKMCQIVVDNFDKFFDF